MNLSFVNLNIKLSFAKLKIMNFNNYRESLNSIYILISNSNMKYLLFYAKNAVDMELKLK